MSVVPDKYLPIPLVTDRIPRDDFEDALHGDACMKNSGYEIDERCSNDTSWRTSCNCPPRHEFYREELAN